MVEATGGECLADRSGVDPTVGHRELHDLYAGGAPASAPLEPPTDEQRDRPVLGVTLQTLDLAFDFPLDVEIASDEIGGPSAGLAFTLEVLDVLTEGELTGGRRVDDQLFWDGEEIDGIRVRVVELTGDAGDVTLMLPWTLHAISPNGSDRPRMMVTHSVYRYDQRFFPAVPASVKRGLAPAPT